MSRRRLYVDGQVLQTGAKDRGMGRYAICVLRALLEQQGVDMEVILSRDLPISDALERELSELLPGAVFSQLPLWSLRSKPVEVALAHNKRVLTDYLADKQPEEADYFIPSLFQDPGVAAYPDGVRAKTALFHDLIPYLYHGRYEKFMGYADYLKRFGLIFESDIIFTNSQTVADDLNMYLGVPRHKLCRVDGAAIVFDRTMEQPKIDIDRPFVLFNTSDDPRKNNLRAVLAFEEYRIASGSDVLLVATSTINRAEQEKLRSISKHILFTGSIPWQQVNWLFDHCEAVLFVSESEGLGLPLLEAVEFNKKVVASSISVLQEISPDEHAFFFCDQESTSSRARALDKAMDPKTSVNKAAYQEVAEYYTWANTAQRMLVGLDAFKKETMPAAKPRVAVFVPVPSGLSGVGLTHAAILHPTLSERFEVDYFIEQGLSRSAVRPDYLKYVAPCFPAASFSVDRYGEYDAVIYHMGNGDYHMEAIKNALYLPGYLIVHDTHIPEAYRVLRETGVIPPERVDAETRLDELKGIQKSINYSSLANRQLGIVTHSQYAADAMREVLVRDVPIVASCLSTNVPELRPVKVDHRITIGLGGAIADVKGLRVIQAIAQDGTFHDCDIRLFGYNHASQETIDKLNSYENVMVATNVSDFDFQTSMSKLDVYVNFRLTYKGESSTSTLEAMRQGGVVIVKNIGWYAELPDDVVVKVSSEEEVIAKLKHLVSNQDALREIGTRARAYVATYHTYERYVSDIARLIEGVRNGENSGNPNEALAHAIKRGDIRSAGQMAEYRGKHNV